MAKSATLTLVPVYGKFCQYQDPKNGRKHEIWKVHPTTPNQMGTKVAYEDGVMLLLKQPQIVNLIEGELDPDDKAKIRETQISGQSSLPHVMNPSMAQQPYQNASNEELIGIIRQQFEQMNALTQALVNQQSVQSNPQNSIPTFTPETAATSNNKPAGKDSETVESSGKSKPSLIPLRTRK